MKKILSFLLALAMLLSLLGCSADHPASSRDDDEEEEEEEAYSVQDVMVCQALELASLTGAMAQKDYLAFSGAPESCMSYCMDFAFADDDPDFLLIAELDDADIGKTLTQYCGHLMGDTALVAFTILSHQTRMRLPEKLEDTTAILVDYDEYHRILVVFSPLEGRTVSVCVYPVFYDILEYLIPEYFSHAWELDDDEIEEALHRAEDVSCNQRPGEEPVTAAYFEDLALSVLDTIPGLTAEDVYEYTYDPQVADLAVYFSSHCGAALQEITVLSISDPQLLMEEELSEIRSSRVREQAQRNYCAAIPQMVTNSYGAAYVAASAVVRNCARSISVGPVLAELDTPVLVIVKYSDDCCALVSFYDSGYGIYSYAFSFAVEIPQWEEGYESMGIVPIF